MSTARSLEATYHAKADKRGPDECWPWTGSRNHKGYGAVTRRVDGHRRYIKATHIAWEIANGRPWPEGMFALHSCDNPICVNPAHIRPGTPADNGADKRARCRPYNWSDRTLQRWEQSRRQPINN